MKQMNTFLKAFGLAISAALLMLLSSCAPRVLVLASEADLKPGLTISQVESLLGPPVYQKGESTPANRIEARGYVSKDSNKLYIILYRNGVSERIDWEDFDDVAEQSSRNDLGFNQLAYGQTKDQVRQVAGQPGYVSGTEFETCWWYFASDEEIYLVLFRDNALIKILPTTRHEIEQVMQD